MGVHGVEPLEAGVRFLPLCISIVPFGIVSGIIVEKTGEYRALHWLGYAFMALGAGLCSILDENSGAGEWATYQILIAIGGGPILSTLLTAILAGLEEKDVAAATGAYSFLRSFGQIWGVTVAAVIFNQEFQLKNVSDTSLIDRFEGGAAYAESSSDIYATISVDDRAAIVAAYENALAPVFQAAAAFAAASFFLVFFEKRLELRKTMNTEFGLSEKAKPDRGGAGDHTDEKV
jgi:hypothetical protein